MRRAILITVDGLRRDFVSAAKTPNLWAFRDKAEWFDAYSTVFPSCTRVVSASVATGCHPARHSLQGNTMVLDEAGALVRHDAGHPDFLQHKRRVSGWSLRVPTLAERLVDQGGAVIFSNVSPGAAYAHDPDGFGHVFHRAGSFGPGRIPLAEAEALRVSVDTHGDAAMVERFIDRVVHSQADAPALGVLWLSEPDASQHALALGSPGHLDILRRADENVGRVIAAIEALEDRDDVLLLIGSDHGHQSVERVVDVEAELVEAGLKQSLTSPDVVVASNGTSFLVYIHPDAAPRTEAMEQFLRDRPWVGTVHAAGTLAEIGLAPIDQLCFAVSMAASELPNRYGIPGTSVAAKRSEGKEDTIGAGQHGGLGRYEQMPFLMVSGGGFTPGAVREDATVVVDLAPTILAHIGCAAHGMDGRALQHNRSGA